MAQAPVMCGLFITPVRNLHPQNHELCHFGDSRPPSARKISNMFMSLVVLSQSSSQGPDARTGGRTAEQGRIAAPRGPAAPDWRPRTDGPGLAKN